ncbi:MarR family transcriptional regulator [Solirubrobacter sp. CPCC 204708]|uniref:MarR family transcriptional regulator n=1 Tax=Solirubrobacter deserti TaxID=2282478 RepID=A0ABT4RQL4_9ACTN|nr:MarR family transcriptional regulator [Solirubrobacter deserti]MBE2319361.1 MarR family transcriptional regulator [Solirubrobacter deserti]MDA0140859.1 MarR family transcriptional regulator [Solirubrobacter deserti]
MDDHLDRVLAQWRSERPDLQAASMGVVGRIQRASRLLERSLAENFARHGLELWEFDVLGTLRRSGPPYRLTPGALSESSMVTAGAITNRIDRLVRKGLVTRDTDPDSRRSVIITLTEQGRSIVEDVLVPHIDHEDRLLAVLDRDEREQLAAVLRKLLLELGDRPSPAMRVPER